MPRGENIAALRAKKLAKKEANRAIHKQTILLGGFSISLSPMPTVIFSIFFVRPSPPPPPPLPSPPSPKRLESKNARELPPSVDNPGDQNY